MFRPQTGEAPFGAEEIFFSRTDQRGVIQAGNFVFQRVSDYAWEDLLGAPHKLIRHPDMPKGVFWLFWETLKAGRPVGAYVKNKARDGLHYWVYAVALPFEDGFLSIRIKPCSDMLATIQKEYQDLRAAEIEKDLTPEESAKALCQRIKDLGFADYSTFESDCLARELAARDKEVGASTDPSVVRFGEMVAAANDLKTETEMLADGFEAISTVPTNMRIIAARLEPSGGAVSSLSQNYWEMSEEMSRWFQNYIGSSSSDFVAIGKTLVSCQFMFGLSRIISAVATTFRTERRALGGCDIQSEQQHMNKLAQQFQATAKKGVMQIAQEAKRISRAVDMMRRYTLGLSSTRVMCNIESARLPAGGGSLVDVINQLGAFQTQVERHLDQIDEHSLTIQSSVEGLTNSEGALLARPQE